MEYLVTWALAAQVLFSCADSQVCSSTGLSNMLGSMTMASVKLNFRILKRTRVGGGDAERIEQHLRRNSHGSCGVLQR